MSATAPTLVPSARVGALLRSHRISAGLTFDELAVRADARYSTQALRQIESGHRALPPELLDDVVELYGIDPELVRTPGSELVLDLDAASLQVGDWWVSFSADSIDDILDSYLEMVRAIRGLESVEPFILRSDDLVVLGDALAVEPERLRTQINDRLAPRPTTRPERLRIAAVATGLATLAIVVALVLVRPPWQPDQLGVSSQVAVAAVVAAPQPVAGQPASAVTTAQSEPASPAPLPPELTVRQRAIEAAIPWDFRTALADWTIVHAGPHQAWWGVTNSVERTVTLFDRPGTSVDEAAAVLVHELGHAVDLDLLDDAQRIEWMRMRDMPTVWWADSGSSDFAVGAGDFAEAVAVVVLGAPSRSEYGGFTDDQLVFVEQFITGR